jgi:D-inositol-3-phosphate glycosyltransferase
MQQIEQSSGGLKREVWDRKRSVRKRIITQDSMATSRAEIHVGLLTGGVDKHYVFGLATALISKGVQLDVIGSDHIDSRALHTLPTLNFLNLFGKPRNGENLLTRVGRVLVCYARIMVYAATARPRILHVLWNYKVPFFDRTLLMLYYRHFDKKVVFTAHNINAAKRDSNDSWLNRLTLRIQYRLADHIFVHTHKMKNELLEDFAVPERKVTIIPFGINNAVPNTELTPDQAKRSLGIKAGERTILFFGKIAPYKGVHFLVAAFQQLAITNPTYRLIIAGTPRAGCKEYLEEIEQSIMRNHHSAQVIRRIKYIPDEEIELYFKAADVLALPYTQISQSGVLFLSYGFGLPVVAADVGSLREDIVEGRTGFLCKPCEPFAMADTIETYFGSDLFRELNSRRDEVRAYALERHSWQEVGEKTQSIYGELLARRL